MLDSEVMKITIKKTDGHLGRHVRLFTEFQLNDSKTADVNLMLADKTVIEAHRVLLSVSPVLKTVFNSIEVRLDTRPCVYLQDFQTQAVMYLLSFIYSREI